MTFAAICNNINPMDIILDEKDFQYMPELDTFKIEDLPNEDSYDDVLINQDFLDFELMVMAEILSDT